jgi:hypothetical protein
MKQRGRGEGRGRVRRTRSRAGDLVRILPGGGPPRHPHRLACASGGRRDAVSLRFARRHRPSPDLGVPPRRRGFSLPRKEVIQPQLPLRLPCYDFVPVTSPTFDSAFLAVALLASGVTSSHDVTGGVYKARERIQRTIADARLLATPASCRRVAACNLN